MIPGEEIVVYNYDSINKYDISFRENKRLQKKLNEVLNENAYLKQRNDALQRVIVNRKGETASEAIPLFVENEEGRLYDGNIFINKKQCLVLDAIDDPKKYLNNLVIVLFGTEVLKKSSVKGGKSNRFKDKEEKPRLDPVKMNLVYKLVAAKSGYDPKFKISDINKILARKINNLVASGKPRNNKSKYNIDMNDDEISDEEITGDPLAA